MIDRFLNEYYFLSNFYHAPLTFGDIEYQNSEAAYQAQKTIDIEERKAFSELRPNEAKLKGREVNLRSDWELIKIDVMYAVCKAKFDQNPMLKMRLLETGNEELVEGNDWGDKTWGKVNGEGENHLGKILMKLRDEYRTYNFDVKAVTDKLIKWVKTYFEKNGNPNTKAIIGISGGKDSSVAAAICVKALGKDRVIGVLMPQHEQADINYSKQLVEFLDITSYTVNIGPTVDAIQDAVSAHMELTSQATINTPARIRMATLYAVAACVGGRVVNTCNLSEDYVGYSTKFGDSAGDFSPLGNLTVAEVIAIGDYLGLPHELTHKVPSDGLCGKTDEDNLGFSYETLDRYIREGKDTLKDNPELMEKIENMHKRNLHKLRPMPTFSM